MAQSKTQTDFQPETDAFRESLGIPFEQALDLNRWHKGADLSQLYPELRRMVAESVEQERRIREPIRKTIFPQLRAGSSPHLPSCAGVYRIEERHIKQAHCGLLFNGGTECCDGNVQSHNSLALSIYQIGMALVKYQGDSGTWVHQLYRRDILSRLDDPIEEMMQLLQKRQAKESDNTESPRDPLARLMRRTLMDWAERAILFRQGTALWRMGHGNPIAQTLLFPTTEAMVQDTVSLFQELVQHRRFVYVASEPKDQFLLTIGNALNMLEFAIVDSLEHQLSDAMLDRLPVALWGRRDLSETIRQCVRAIRSEIVTGVYRATSYSPARVFYAHKDFACEAATLAIADSVLQPHRGFPMLIDLADTVCGNHFDHGTLSGVVHEAYGAAGEPTRYLGERETRQ